MVIGAIASAALRYAPRVASSIVSFVKSGIGKTAIFTGVTTGISYGAKITGENLRSAVGINETENSKNRQEEYDAMANVFEKSKDANPDNINAVKEGMSGADGLGIKEIVIIGSLVAVGVVGVYYMGRK